MSWITASDPLALVAIQSGQVNAPSTKAAAAGNSNLDTPQRSIVLGEPVPIAFCRRRNGYGGVLVSPGAGHCRFENDASNNVTAYYCLPVSEGQLPGIQVRDAFQGPCRVGSISQTYNRAAGNWQPGNFIVERTGYTKPEASYYCGSVGAYPDITTVSYKITVPDPLDFWKKQVHFYLRGGMQVTRLTDGQFGPSDNFADLAKWMLLNCGRFPASLIDTTRLAATAQFLENTNLTCNCYITQSTNYLDYLSKWAPSFLVCESSVNGKRGLRPLLPTTAANVIDTGAITPVFTFTEDHILPGSLEIQYTTLTERRPFVVQLNWRQQLEDDFGIIRTAEVRYNGTADNGPYESHDLSEFCTREEHAVKVGAYILSRRVNTTHTIRFSARPTANTTVVTQADIIRVRLARASSGGGTSYHDFLYQVQRITKTLAGELSYECTHFPVDAQGRSLFALDVAAATGSGILLDSNKSGLGCDLNSKTDTTVPPETYSSFDYTAIGGGGSLISLPIGSETTPGGDVSNPGDPYAGSGGHSVTGPDGVTQPVEGATLQPQTDICAPNGTSSIKWYRNGEEISSIEYFRETGGLMNSILIYTGSQKPAINLQTGALQIPPGSAGVSYMSVVTCVDNSTTPPSTKPGITQTTTVIDNVPGQPGMMPAGHVFTYSFDYGYSTGRGGGFGVVSYGPAYMLDGYINGARVIMIMGFPQANSSVSMLSYVTYDIDWAQQPATLIRYSLAPA